MIFAKSKPFSAYKFFQSKSYSYVLRLRAIFIIFFYSRMLLLTGSKRSKPECLEGDFTFASLLTFKKLNKLSDFELSLNSFTFYFSGLTIVSLRSLRFSSYFRSIIFGFLYSSSLLLRKFLKSCSRNTRLNEFLVI